MTVCMPGLNPITTYSYGLLVNCATVGQATHLLNDGKE